MSSVSNKNDLKAFQNLKVGNITLDHRIVFAPSTRFRADTNHVPLPIVKEYYGQRASTPGTLLISEANGIAPEATGLDNVPGIWSEEQVKAWSEITAKVHENKSYIYLQLWATGRAAYLEVLQKEKGGPYPLVSASNISIKDHNNNTAPQPLTIPEINKYKGLYAQAAKNAIRAGFDGVEIHGANGYIIDQFLQDVSNNRTDEYGGSIENRARFGLEVVDAVAHAIGAERVGVRLSPWGLWQDMKMEDPIPTFTHFVKQLKTNHPNLSYLHVVEPRGNTHHINENGKYDGNNDFLREIWSPKPYISCGGWHYDTKASLEVAEEKGDLLAFSRMFVSNPDLPIRLKHGFELNPYDRDTFYVPGSTDPKGYTDYPFAKY